MFIDTRDYTHIYTPERGVKISRDTGNLKIYTPMKNCCNYTDLYLSPILTIMLSNLYFFFNFYLENCKTDENFDHHVLHSPASQDRQQ